MLYGLVLFCSVERTESSTKRRGHSSCLVHSSTIPQITLINGPQTYVSVDDSSNVFKGMSTGPT